MRKIPELDILLTMLESSFCAECGTAIIDAREVHFSAEEADVDDGVGDASTDALLPDELRGFASSNRREGDRCRCAVAVAAVLVGTLMMPSAYADDAPEGIHLIRDIRYRDGNSPAWRLDLAMPMEVATKPRPAIVVIHGGGWIEGDKSSFSTPNNPPPGNIFDFVRQGFVALTINYRMSNEAPYPAALHDCKCAVRWLRAHADEYHVDPHRIGVWGNSAGGHLALLLAMTNDDPAFEGDGPWKDFSSQVQCAVSDSGPVDLTDQYEQGTLRTVVDRFMAGPPTGDRREVYLQASPSNRIHPNVPPLLLIYGVDDNQVPIESTDRFVFALDQAGLKDVSYHRLARVGHCPHSLIRVPWVSSVVDEFFQRALDLP